MRSRFEVGGANNGQQRRTTVSDGVMRTGLCIASLCVTFFLTLTDPQGGEDESEEEEDDAALLDVVEKRLLEFDPTFKQSDTKAGRAVKQDATILSFIRGGRPDYDPESVDQAYQLHLNVERLRVPETWFQPSMVGLDSAGLSEIAGWIVNGYGDAERRRIMDVSTDVDAAEESAST